MLGAIIGDIVGSRFEWRNIKTKDFIFFADRCEFTDDTVMTLAIAAALVEWQQKKGSLQKKVIKKMQRFGRLYPYAGYGGMFSNWLASSNPTPYNSYGNGAAMRISSVAYAGNTLDQVKDLSWQVTAVTHNHSEGIKGAEATAVAIFLARTGKKLAEIKSVIEKEYYPLNDTLDEIRPTYRFNETCQGTVPQALLAFFQSVSFEDAIRNAVSLGGDSDTIAAICGSVAEAYYGIPSSIKERAFTYLDNNLIKIIDEFCQSYGSYNK